MSKKQDKKVFIQLWKEYQVKLKPYSDLAVEEYLARTEDIYKEYIERLTKAGVEYLRWE